MSVEEIINKLFAKFPGVQIVNIIGNDYLEFSIQHRRYSARVGGAVDVMELKFQSGVASGFERTMFSARIEGILAGKVRNAAGELVHA